MSRLRETLSTVPPFTRLITAACILTYAFQFLFDPNVHDYTMCPRDVLYLHEYYRLLTSCLFHGGIMHIGMNTMSTLAIGGMLEKRLGTMYVGLTILWGMLLTSATYVSVSWLLWGAFGYERMMIQHSLGFSGVIFQLSVMESNLGPPDRARSVFGVFSVPSKLYPWALLVVLQFVMPQISFLGHLSGILVGTMQYHGALDFLFPDETCLRELEASDHRLLGGGLRGLSGYVVVQETTGLARGERPDARTALLSGFGFVAVFVQNVCETIKVCILGRGADANSNVQLNEIGAAWGSDAVNGGGAGAMMPGNVEDDEEWVGLPAAIQRSTEEM